MNLEWTLDSLTAVCLMFPDSSHASLASITALWPYRCKHTSLLPSCSDSYSLCRHRRFMEGITLLTGASNAAHGKKSCRKSAAHRSRFVVLQRNGIRTLQGFSLPVRNVRPWIWNPMTFINNLQGNFPDRAGARLVSGVDELRVSVWCRVERAESSPSSLMAIKYLPVTMAAHRAIC